MPQNFLARRTVPIIGNIHLSIIGFARILFLRGNPITFFMFWVGGGGVPEFCCTIKGYGKNLGPPPDFYRKVIGFARILFLRGNPITFFLMKRCVFSILQKKKTHPNLRAEIQKSAFFS